MVREPDATRQPTPQDIQLMSKRRVLSFKPQVRLEWRGQDGKNETEQPDHSASLGDSITSSTRIRFSVHTGHDSSYLYATATQQPHLRSRFLSYWRSVRSNCLRPIMVWAEEWTARTKRLGTRHLGRQVVETCRAPRSGLARTVACRRLRRSISIRYRAALI